MVWRARSAHAKHKAAYTALRARALLWCACAWGESGWVVKMGDKRTMRWGCARACGAGSVGKGRDAAAAASKAKKEADAKQLAAENAKNKQKIKTTGAATVNKL